MRRIKEPFQRIFVNLLRSSRFRISLIVMVVVLCLVTGAAYFFCWRKEQDLTKELKIRGITIVNMLANQTALAVRNIDDLSLLSYVNTLKDQSDIIYIVVLDAKGQIMAHTTTNKIGQISKDAQDLIACRTKKTLIRLIKSDIYDICTPLLLEGERIGAARIGLSRKKIDTIMAKTYKEAASIAIVISLLMGSILFAIINRIFTKPIIKMNNEFQLVTKERLKTLKIGIPVSGELARLIKTINQALIQMNERRIADGKESQEKIDYIRKEIEKILTLTPQNKGIMVIDSYYKIKHLNSAAERILGQSSQELMEKRITEVMGTDTFLDLLKETLNQAGQITKGSLSFKNKKGETKAVEAELTTVADRNGELVTILVGLSRTTVNGNQ